MNFLIVSKISIPAKDRTLPCWEYLRSLGHEVTVEHPSSEKIERRPDVIISMGVTVMDECFEAMARFPGVPVYQYLWDVYAWVWEPGQEGKVQAYHPCRGQEYAYTRYGELLKQAKEVWVPSACTGRRATQWYGLTNWRVILSACPWWDWPGEDVKDGGYALMCLREIPDPWWGKFEQACGELGIPFVCTRHEQSYEDYQRAVAHCRFICAPLWELSTGGLSLMEAYYHGKPVLINGSEWNGGHDYFGDRADYFAADDYEDFKAALQSTYAAPNNLSRGLCRRWIEANYSDRRMVDDMLKSIRADVKEGVA